MAHFLEIYFCFKKWENCVNIGTHKKLCIRIANYFEHLPVVSSQMIDIFVISFSSSSKTMKFRQKTKHLEYWWALLLCWISWVNESDVSLFQTITLTHALFTFLGLLWIYIQCGMFEVKRKLMVLQFGMAQFWHYSGHCKVETI